MSCELEEAIREAMRVVQQRIEDHQAGRDAPFSAKLLAQVRDELHTMAQEPEYKPKYPRFIIDWPDETGLKVILMDLAYQSSRLKGNR